MPTQSAEAAELETISDACFAYLVNRPEDLARFMAFAGYDGAALRQASGSRELGLGMLDYFVSNESVLVAMCGESGLPVERVMRAWHRLNPSM